MDQCLPEVRGAKLQKGADCKSLSICYQYL